MPEQDQPGEGQESTQEHQPAGEQEEGLLDAEAGDGDQSTDETGSQPDEEEEEIDVDGRKFALPKSAAEKLKQERMRMEDYTRKTQEVAEQRRAIEADAVQLRQQQEDAAAHLREVGQVMAIDAQLHKLGQIDFDALAQHNPVEAMKLDKAIRDLQAARQGIVGTVQQRQQQLIQSRQQQAAKAMQEGVAVLEREIPGFSLEKHGKELKDYMVGKLGAKPERLQGLTEPALILAMHKAKLYDELQAKQTAKPKPTPQAAPVTRITAKQSGTVRDPDKLSAEDWVKWRDSQVRRQAQAARKR